MKSSTITLAVTLALSSSSAVSGMPHYLDSLPAVSLSARASTYLIKRSLFVGQPSDPNQLLKRGNEKRKPNYDSSNSDESQPEDDSQEDEEDDCDESLDSEELAQVTEQYYKIGSNATGARVPSPSYSHSNPSKVPSATGYSSPLEQKRPSNAQSGTSKQWSKPVAEPPKVEKHISHKEPSSSQSYGSSSHAHYGENGGQASSRAGVGSVYHGKATFYSQDGKPGACGVTHQDSDFIVAIQSGMYDGGKLCGKTVVVTRKSTGKSISCIAADECPGCPSMQSLDLSEKAFQALGTPDEGLFEISWKVVEDN